VDYTYDENSNLTNLDAAGTDGTTFNLEKKYNEYDFLTHNKVQNGTKILTTEYNPNASGMLEGIKTPKGYTWEAQRTGGGLVDKIDMPKNHSINYTHDQRGLLINALETEAGGKQLNNDFTHNVLGDQTINDDDLGRKWDFKSNPQTNPLSRKDAVMDPKGGVVLYTYDGLGRTKTIEDSIKDQEKAVTTYHYDLNNNLTAIEDAKSQWTHYEYDSKDRLSDIYYDDQRNEHFDYYTNDRLKTYSDPNNNQLNYKYDNAGRLWRIDVIKGSGVGGPDYEEYQYDGLGRITHIITPDSTVEFQYDKAGRVEKEIQDGIEVGYGHDDNGNLTELRYPSAKTLIISYDELDRIDNITENNEEVVKYGYEGLGKITSKTIRDTVVMSSVFDNGKRMESLSYKNKRLNDTYMQQLMKWDLLNLKTEEKDDKRIMTYNYDNKYRLEHAEETKRNNKTLSYKSDYTLDKVDNILVSTETKDGQVETTINKPNSLNQVSEVNNKVLSYDNNGNLNNFTHDYQYDWKNRLIKVITGTGLNVEFKYDGLGRRTRKIVTAPGEKEVTRYIYAGWRVIEERKGEFAGNNDVIHRYTYGNGIDERIEMEKPVVKKDGSVEWKRYFFLHDNIGNVIGLTNDKGHLIERYKYTPYGEVTFYNGKIQPDIDGIKIKNGKIYIRFKQPVDLETMYVTLRLTHTQVEISGNTSLLNKDRDIEFSPTNALTPNETLTLKVEMIGDSGPVEILTKNFTYQGGELEIVYDEVPPRVERVKYKENSFFIDFSEEINPATTFNNIEITLGDSKLPGTIEITGDNQVKLTLDSHLSDNTCRSPLIDPG
jgi:YD repeat-containing protein